MRLPETATFVLLLLTGFLGMELVTYLVHRFVMHGALERLHLSHHRNAAAEFASKSPEANDVFPLAFSAVVSIAMWAGFNIDGLSWLLPTFIGVTIYGIIYTVIHDGVIHGRVRWLKHGTSRIANGLAVAHRSHHLANGEPYGMLFPWLTMQHATRTTLRHDTRHPA